MGKLKKYIQNESTWAREWKNTNNTPSGKRPNQTEKNGNMKGKKIISTIIVFHANAEAVCVACACRLPCRDKGATTCTLLM